MLSLPQVNVYYYQEADGTCPVREFLLAQTPRVQVQAEVRIKLLTDRGHTLHRPYCDNLGAGLWELRWHTGRVQYRVLYSFHGQHRAILLHALTKEGAIPVVDLARAQHRRQFFMKNPTRHTKP